MAEEDEIDVLGDFNLDLSKNNSNIYDGSALVSQTTELLNCDYTIHPQWLLDRPSTNPDIWYDTNTVLATDKGQNDSDCLGHVSTENCITDESGWTEKEKNLLERGIEIFGKSNVRLSQFIGSKTAPEVKYYLKNFYVDTLTNKRNITESVFEGHNLNNLVSDVVDDMQIPASIEEVIAAVSTAKPTVRMVNKRLRKGSSTSSDNNHDIDFKSIPVGHSMLKLNYKNFYDENSEKNKKQNAVRYKTKANTRKSTKFKFKTKLKMQNKEVQSPKKNYGKFIPSEVRTSNIEITTGNGLAVPISEGEEIVKIKKANEDSESDVEIDIEDDLDTADLMKMQNKKEANNGIHIETPIASSLKTMVDKENDENPDNSIPSKQPYFNLSNLNEATIKELYDLHEPKCAAILEPLRVAELEKVIHSEFFGDKPSKTPSRYLKIRNHILSTWFSIKPAYLTKTAARQCLRNCGDVNSIGRIHYFLEQIGAINFGCPQVQYVRPLYNMLQVSLQLKETAVKDLVKKQGRHLELGSRSRNKKKFYNDGEGGCTLTHDEKGQVINTTIVNKEPAKQRVHIKKPIIRLMYCRSFTAEKPQQYVIRLHLSTLLQMDFHAHTSLKEVMGLVAGYWNSQDKTLTICHYESCRNLASSTTHCDMCPISQAKAADTIHNQGLDILGWFHSHPTFAPEPSQQDLDTQQVVQQWIGSRKPCIGVILSPFSLNGALIASPYRCMIVDKKENFDDQYVPYKFEVQVISFDFDVEGFLNDLQRLFNCNTELNDKIDFTKPYFQDCSITYLDKFISSVQMHLAKCGGFTKKTCDAIIQGIMDICMGKK